MEKKTLTQIIPVFRQGPKAILLRVLGQDIEEASGQDFVVWKTSIQPRKEDSGRVA